MMSLYDLISGKISENSIPLGMLLHQALHCAENPERVQFEEEGQEFGLGYPVVVEHRCQVYSREEGWGLG